MKITLFNHFHRGDLFTHKEFARDLKAQLPDVTIEYWHYNHPKVNLDLGIPLTSIPEKLDRNVALYADQERKDIWVNTWIGVHGEIFTRCGGVNLNSLYESWGLLYQAINNMLEVNVKLKPNKFDYMPRIDYTFFDTVAVDTWCLKSKDRKRVLICNGSPMSNQSFSWDMTQIIKNFADEYPEVDFYCTKKFDNDLPNVFFTDDIIPQGDDWSIKPHWVDRPLATCDLNEISYLSTHCDVIIGKNSGPFVFCETRDNYLDKNKHIVSFSRGSQESMSHEVNEIECKYLLVTDHTPETVSSTLRAVIEDCL